MLLQVKNFKNFQEKSLPEILLKIEGFIVKIYF